MFFFLKLFVTRNIIFVYIMHRVTTDYELTEDEDNLLNAPFIPKAPIKLLVHGYTGHQHYSPNTELRPGTVTVILHYAFMSNVPAVYGMIRISCYKLYVKTQEIIILDYPVSKKITSMICSVVCLYLYPG